jgi:hypothetical protein
MTLAIAAFVIFEFVIVAACPLALWLDWRR